MASGSSSPDPPKNPMIRCVGREVCIGWNKPNLTNGYNKWRRKAQGKEDLRHYGPNGQLPEILRIIFRNFNYDWQFLEDVQWHCRNYDNQGVHRIFPTTRNLTHHILQSPQTFEFERTHRRLSRLIKRRKLDYNTLSNANVVTRTALLSQNKRDWPLTDRHWFTTGNQDSPWSKTAVGSFWYPASPTPGYMDFLVPFPRYANLFVQWLPRGIPPESTSGEEPKLSKKSKMKLKFKSSKKADREQRDSTPPPSWKFIIQEDARLLKMEKDKQRTAFRLAAAKATIQQMLRGFRDTFKNGQVYADECEESFKDIMHALTTMEETTSENGNEKNAELKEYYETNKDSYTQEKDSILLLAEQFRASYNEAKKHLERLEAAYQTHHLKEDYDVKSFTKKATGFSNFPPLMRLYVRQIETIYDRVYNYAEAYQKILKKTTGIEKGSLVL